MSYCLFSNGNLTDRVGSERGRERHDTAVGGWLGWWWCQWRLLTAAKEGIGEQYTEELSCF